MTIERTIEIPADHRLTIEVPPEIPAGGGYEAVNELFIRMDEDDINLYR